MAALKCKAVYSALQGEGIAQKSELIQFMMQIFLVWHIKYCKYISCITENSFSLKNSIFNPFWWWSLSDSPVNFMPLSNPCAPTLYLLLKVSNGMLYYVRITQWQRCLAEQVWCFCEGTTWLIKPARWQPEHFRVLQRKPVYFLHNWGNCLKNTGQ